MPSDEFVQRINKEIADQKNTADSLREEKLHDAKVIATGGQSAWAELNRELMDCMTKIQTIAITQKPDGRSLELVYGNARLNVRSDTQTAVIHYEGVMGKGGKFEPKVHGENLVYCGYENQAITIAEIAEQLITVLVARR